MFRAVLDAMRNMSTSSNNQPTTWDEKGELSQKEESAIRPIDSFDLPAVEQSKCPLFSVLPGEVRGRIYEYALSCSYDLTRTYDDNTSYKRPDYLAAQKVDVNLLRTCQHVYTEAWYLPWSSTTHTFWLAWEDRRPDEVLSPEEFQKVLDFISGLHGKVELSHIQIFSQLCSLEPGANELDPILSLDHFFPRSMTITIRHHDWWYWENDEPLFISGWWVNEHRFPDSLLELRLELETLQRKKDQIDYIVKNMVHSWQFQTISGTQLCAVEEGATVSHWTGSSTWENERWIRDETKPEQLEYYIKTVVFKPTKGVTQSEAHTITVPDTFKAIESSIPYLRVDDIEAAEVPPGSSADEALKCVQDWATATGNSISPGQSESESDGESDEEDFSDDQHDSDAEDDEEMSPEEQGGSDLENNDDGHTMEE